MVLPAEFGDWVSRDCSLFEHDPARVVRFDEQLHKFLVGIIGKIYFTTVKRRTETVPHEIKIMLQPIALKILWIAIPADGHVGMVSNFHNCLDGGQFGTLPMDF